MVWHGGRLVHSGPSVVGRKAGVGAAARVLRGGCVGGGGVPGKALSRVQREARRHPLVNNARWRAGEAPVPDSTARNS